MVVAATTNYLKTLRQRHGLAQAGLAVRPKVSPNTVVSIERWGHVPTSLPHQS